MVFPPWSAFGDCICDPSTFSFGDCICYPSTFSFLLQHSTSLSLPTRWLWLIIHRTPGQWPGLLRLCCLGSRANVVTEGKAVSATACSRVFVLCFSWLFLGGSMSNVFIQFWLLDLYFCKLTAFSILSELLVKCWWWCGWFVCFFPHQISCFSGELSF